MEQYYKNDLFQLKGISGEHSISDIDIYIGTGIIRKIPEYLGKRNFGKKCLIVADNNTWHAAGEQVAEILRKSKFSVELCILSERINERIEADEQSVGQVVMSLDSESDFLVACGSGVINDITRVVAHVTGKPFISVGTAASMDGYISVIAPMIFDKKKVHRHGSAPKILVLDTDILKKAPFEMTIAGFGDVYGKFIAKADWLISNIINGESINPQALDLISQALNRLVENVDEIMIGTDKGLKVIIEGLILAGITIFTVGNTRAVASVEHNQCHIWETRMLEAGKPYALHGISVGCSTGYFLRMYDYFKQTNPSSWDKEGAKKRLTNYTDFKTELVKCYGEDFLEVLEKENKYLHMTEDVFEKHYQSILDNWDKIIEVLDFLPSWEDYKEIYRKMNHTIFAEEIGIPSDLLKYTLMYSSFYRDRYTFVYALNIMGIIADVTDKTLEDYEAELKK